MKQTSRGLNGSRSGDSQFKALFIDCLKLIQTLCDRREEEANLSVIDDINGRSL
jgi:hypothetical protein